MSRIDGLIVAYAQAREALQAQKEAMRPYQRDLDVAQEALFAAMEDQDLRSIRHETLGLFMLSDLAEPVMDDPLVFVRWAENAMPEILTANRQRLAVVIREILRGDRPVLSTEGDGLPPGVSFTTRRSINWRRS